VAQGTKREISTKETEEADSLPSGGVIPRKRKLSVKGKRQNSKRKEKAIRAIKRERHNKGRGNIYWKRAVLGGWQRKKNVRSQRGMPP